MHGDYKENGIPNRDRCIWKCPTVISFCLFTTSANYNSFVWTNYLRRPTLSNLQDIYESHEEIHGFRRMLSSLDCTYWDWENCPNAWWGQYCYGDHQVLSLILKGVASQNLWIWNAYFSIVGSNNYINILDTSLIFDKVKLWTESDTLFHLRGATYKYVYYLGDGIYPERPHWSKRIKLNRL